MRVAVAQLCSTVDLESNFAKCAALIAKAARANCALICLPENFDWIFPRTRAAEASKHTEALDGPLIRKYAQLAAEHNIWLSLGGFHERYTGAAPPPAL